MPYHISWNVEHGDRYSRALQAVEESENVCPYDSFLAPALRRVRARITHCGFEALFQKKDLWSANRNITKIANTVGFRVWTMKIDLETEKKTTELSISFTHTSIQTYEQKQNVQAALKPTGPKPDQLHSYGVGDITPFWKSSWNRTPAFLFPPHQSPQLSYQFQ